MEDILNKNIFSDKDLCKLSPDYSPTSVLLRMQMRRAMVKDTHTHGVLKNNNSQRITMKRVKESYKANKDIVKFRNGFQKMNLKNQIMLKRAIKSVETIKSKDLACSGDKDDYEKLKNDTDPFLLEISEGTETNLVVCNDSDFKINNKPKPYKIPKEQRNHKMSKNTMDHTNKINEDTIEEILRIKCTFCKPLDADVKQEDTKDISFAPEADSVNTVLPFLNHGIDKQVNDLQALLIMMAITPKSSETEDGADSPPSKCKETTSYNYTSQINPQDLMLVSQTVQSEDISEVLNVTQMRIIINDRQKQILNKYVRKWREHVLKRKFCLAQKRKETLNSFFDKLARKKMSANQSQESDNNKAKILARDFSTYQRRYKVQKHIIALQKIKLEEQSRVIEELKYNKIIEASQHSVDALRDEVRKTYYEIDRHLKPKLKCMTNELHIQELQEPSLVLHCLKVPQFLQRMEKRAREREEKHAMIRERRIQMEEERIRIKQQAELAKEEMDKEEKLKRIKELKEKRKREKIENIRKKHYAEKMRALTVMAELHYEKYLMSKYGIRPLRLLMEIKQDNMEKAKAHYKFQLKNNVFLNWMWYTEDMWFERNYKAQDFCRKKILKKAFESFKLNHHEFVLQKQVAEDYYDLYVTQIAFRKLREGIDIIRKENEIKWQSVVIYHNSNLLFKTFTCWRALPALNALVREQEARKARWREKVLQVVPDYTPPDE